MNGSTSGPSSATQPALAGSRPAIEWSPTRDDERQSRNSGLKPPMAGLAACSSQASFNPFHDGKGRLRPGIANSSA
jgi:hypothetical protein